MAKNFKQIDAVLAKQEDGTIQITFTVPVGIIKSAEDTALAQLAKETLVPGFRKGNAPIDKVREKIPTATLIEKALGKILPKAFGDATTKFKIKPLIYPKFELLSAKDGEDWQIRAVTCEMPEVRLGDYQKAITDALKATSIWTPGKGTEKPKEKSKEEKEQEVIRTLIATSEVNIPKPLLDEEVDARLSGLLERTERLGLSLEKYLASIGKTPEGLRTQYEQQARESIKFDLILAKIADEKNISASETEIDTAIKQSASDDITFERLNTPEQRRVVASILKKRAALDSLTSLL